MADKKQNIASRVREAVEPTIIAMGFSIWQVSFYKEGAERILEIELDKEGGIDIEACSAVTAAIDPIIDALDPIEEAYCLMVSGAGLERTLSNDIQFDYAIAGGYPTTAKLFTALDGKKEYGGVLLRYDGDAIYLNCDEKEIKIDRKLISRLTIRCG